MTSSVLMAPPCADRVSSSRARRRLDMSAPTALRVLRLPARSCPWIAVVEAHRVPGLGEEEPPLGQQADDTAERCGETELPARDTAREPEQRKRKAQHERRRAQ